MRGQQVCENNTTRKLNSGEAEPASGRRRQEGGEALAAESLTADSKCLDTLNGQCLQGVLIHLEYVQGECGDTLTDKCVRVNMWFDTLTGEYVQGGSKCVDTLTGECVG